MPKEEKTLVMKMLDRASIPYEVRTYVVTDENYDGLTIARAAGLPPRIMYKTIVTMTPSHELRVFVLPVGKELDLKAAARAASEKSLSLVHVKDLPRLTGYVRGGCSPLGLKKPCPVIVDDDVRSLPAVWISAGRRGVAIGLAPEDLLKMCAATSASITSEGDEHHASQ